MNPQGPILCADLGGTKIHAAVVDDKGNLAASRLTLTEAERGPARVIERIISVLSDALRESRIDPEAIPAIGIGAPGPLDPSTGTLHGPPNLPGWDNICLARMLEERLDVPCFVDNDVNVATLGEHRHGAAQGADCAVGVFVGTGVGGGIIVNGSLHYGFHGTAGEVGHLIVAAGRAPCNCGANGCLEAVASRTALVKRIRSGVEAGEGGPRLREALKEHANLPSTLIGDLYRSGDPVVMDAVEDARTHLGWALGSLINLLGPEVIVLGGGVIEAMWDLFEEKVKETAMESSLPLAGRDVRIVRAELGDNAGVIGAAEMARDRLRAHAKTTSHSGGQC